MELSFSHPAWIVSGVIMMAIGIWMIRWANRHNVARELAGAAANAAITTLRKGGKLEVPSELGARVSEIASAKGATGKTKKVAGYVARQALSQLFGTGGFILAVAGFLTALLGVFYT